MFGIHRNAALFAGLLFGSSCVWDQGESDAVWASASTSPSDSGTTGNTSDTLEPSDPTGNDSTTGDEAASTGPGHTTDPPDPSGSTGGPSADCVDLDLGSALGPRVASGTTVGQGNDFAAEDCGGGASGGPDYVIEWTAPNTAMYEFSLVDSNFDTVLSAVSPVCGAPPKTCNDDCDEYTSAIGYEANAGETIYIVIEGYWGATGNFSLDIYPGVEPDCCGGDTWGDDCYGSTSSWATTGWGTYWGSDTGWSGTDGETGWWGSDADDGSTEGWYGTTGGYGTTTTG